MHKVLKGHHWVLALLLTFLLLAVPTLSSLACTITVTYVGSVGNVHEYKVVFVAVPAGDSLAFHMTNLSGVTAAGVKAGAGWVVLSQSSHTVAWTSSNPRGTTARLTVTSAQPLYSLPTPAVWIGGCKSTASVSGNVPGVPPLAGPTITKVNALITAGKFQKAINKLITDTKFNTANMQGGNPIYDAALIDAGRTTVNILDGKVQKIPSKIRIGDDAFTNAAGAADAKYLYSTIIHENVHAGQIVAGSVTIVAKKIRGIKRKVVDNLGLIETEAYLMELECAVRVTGVSRTKSQMDFLKGQLAKYATMARINRNLSAALKVRVEKFLKWDAANNKYIPKP